MTQYTSMTKIHTTISYLLLKCLNTTALLSGITTPAVTCQERIVPIVQGLTQPRMILSKYASSKMFTYNKNYLIQPGPFVRSHGDVFAKLTTGCWDLLAIQRAGM